VTRPSSSGNALSFLGPRYRLVRALAQGGFGHTYLAEDTHRFNELCVLKELAPQVEGEAALQKAKQLFEREAGVLYKLQHPQIPRFRELLRVGESAGGHLFLVQDYIEGPTYRELLDTRCRYGSAFNETEVTQLLAHLLPVVAYIHGVGVIHRDISPENLILRNADGLPVLIDFGGVKQVSATAEAQFGGSPATGANVTRLGKLGYAPVEQLHQGNVTPASDLYSLAVTVVVLLTGKDPQDLYDAAKATWHWRRQVAVSDRLGQTLDRMLSPQPQNRYPSASAVMAALNLSAQTRPRGGNPSAIATVAVGRPPLPSPVTPSRAMTEATAAVPARARPSHPKTTAARPQAALLRQASTRSSRQLSGLIQAVVGLGLVMGSVAVVWWVAAEWQPESVLSDLSGQTGTGDSNAEDEQARLQQLRDRREALGIDSRSWVAMTDQLFYDRHPNLVGQSLSDAPEDAPLRLRWHTVATDLLDKLDSHLSSTTRERLGSYRIDNLDNWTQRVNQLSVSRRALNALTDAQFQRLFPNQAEADFLDQPIGQVWYALAEDQVRAMESGDGLTAVTFEAGESSQQQSGQLEPGTGQIYTLYLSEGQQFRLNLQAPRNSTRLSIYLPQPSSEQPYLLSLSRDRSWAGELPQTGYYEVMVVSNRDRTVEYQLTLSTD
jgi:serine/threonine-protein kinase